MGGIRTLPRFYTFWDSDVLHSQRADGIEDGEDHDADVGEDGQPHIRDAARAEDQTGCLDDQREHDVLVHDTDALAGDADGLDRKSTRLNSSH